ncbi:zinc-dependent metalloprotease [Polaribacter sp.]|nr:zinc-dependent metalloprotease [Polaribacter sp.]
MKKLVSVVLFLFFSYFSYGQFCGFDLHRSELEKNPNFIAQEKASEQRIKLATQRIRAESQQRKSANQSTDLLTIPIVVHVLHLGEEEGTGTNISDAQIESSIAHLNSFYRGQTTGSSIDFQIEMKLAQRSPTCEITTGINRIDASDVEGYKEDGVSLYGNGASDSTLKQLSLWPASNYLNIWIVSEIDGNNGGGGYQGYANFFNGRDQEGLVMMHTVFGYDPTDENTGWPLSLSRDNSVVVHELGHYFHLYHTFQGDDAAVEGDPYEPQCPENEDPTTDGDLCADTEPHKRETSSCPVENSCTSANWENDNTKKNIMSYYRCTDRMTADQKTRVRAVMEGSSIVNSKGSQQLNQLFVAPNAVCSTNSVSTWSSGILGVTLNGVTMTSSYSAGDDGNIDETSNCVNYFEIDGAVSYDLEVALSINFQQLGVWIDWNDDGDFEDANEQQYLDDDISDESIVQISINYPENIPYNDYVRIRLICDIDDRYTGNPKLTSPCTSTLTDGQSEDYTIYVKESSTASIAKNNVLNVSLHPNPAKNEVNISAKNTIETVTIYNVLGKKVSSYTVNATSKNLDIANLSSGIYVLKYLSSNAVGSLKFVKE